jgi:energy-coupling factor transporter ATP-binding protein EcfA2
MNALTAQITVETRVAETPRVQQVCGLFDLSLEQAARVSWNVHLPLDEKPWHIGLIAGPSGCGKSTIARRLWPGAVHFASGGGLEWSPGCAVVDDFPPGLPIKEIIELLCSVGFSSPPAWLRPYQVLSTGQQFRVLLARLLAAAPAEPVVFDEYSSVVDRTVAQVGSTALAKTVRRRGQQFVAVTCHEDVEEWLQPDWVYRPAENRFQWRCLRCRPAIELSIVRCRASAWPLFAQHHYLSHSLCPSAICFLATWRERPVAFSAWITHVGNCPRTKREHRTVTLPDYQGAGIGNWLSAFLASLWTALGYRAISTTTHPAMIASRRRSPHWVMHRAPSFIQSKERQLRSLKHALTRLTAGFTYIGPPLDVTLAHRLLETTDGRKPATPDAAARQGTVRTHQGRRLRTRRLGIPGHPAAAAGGLAGARPAPAGAPQIPGVLSGDPSGTGPRSLHGRDGDAPR